jgi:hypothetical protein
MGNENHFVFRQKLLGDDGSERRDIVMVKQSDLFSPKLGATSSHVLTQSPQNVAVETGIHSLACWDRCFALPQLLYRWLHQPGLFSIPLRSFNHAHKNTNFTFSLLFGNFTEINCFASVTNV